MIAEHPVAHKEGHYRCFLPNLAGFMTLCCTGPGYQTGIYGVYDGQKERSFSTKVRDISLLSFLKEFIYPLQGPSSRKFDDEKLKDLIETVLRYAFHHGITSPEELSTTCG